MGLSYVPVARVGEIFPGKTKPVELGGRQLLLAHLEGRYFVFARECPHEAADLQTGELENTRVRCANHGYCFDLASGECVVPPGGPPLTTLAVEVRGEEICVKLEW
jgi:3-phenylpropionate/trans-cinnamate dioxygenase ferredoxin component